MAILDRPPPSPQLAEAGGAPSMQGLVGDANFSMPGPDMGGLIKLGQTIDESILLLATALPQLSEQLGQARKIVLDALGQATQETAMAPPAPEELSTTGRQFPGGPAYRGGI